MSLDPTVPADEVFANPYAAPGAELAPPSLELDGDLASAEAIRQAHINHEAAVKSVGSLFILGAIFLGIGSVVLLLIAAGVIPSGAKDPRAAQMIRIVTGAVGALYVVLTALNLSVGIGLRKLQPWARWTTVALLGIGVAGVLLNLLGAALMGTSADALGGLVVGLLIGGSINGYMLYLMLAPKSSTVFSRDYKIIVLKTPHVKYRTSKLLMVLLVLIVVLIVVAFAVAIGRR